MKKKIILLFFMLSFAFFAQGQNIKGIVLNADDGNPLAYASVYYKGTLIQTRTNNEGEFNIPILSTQTGLVVSCVGFYPFILDKVKTEGILKVMLKPRVEALKEVVVINDGLDYQTKLEIFKTEFLGTSVFAKKCIISNVDDLNFNYSKSNETLTVTSDKAIEIINPSLGYKLKYDLERFVKSPKGVNIQGNFVFEEIPSTKNNRKVLKNRAAVYKGSRMQFIRAISTNSLAKEGFKISRPGSYSKINRDSLVIYNPIKQLNFLSLNGKRIAIEYSGYVSFLSQNRSFSLIDDSGFYDASLSWFGNMSVERMGDMLPFEYQSASLKKNEQDEKANNNDEDIIEEKKFFENIYIHTNQDFFNPSDTLWFKAYINPLNAADSNLLSKKMQVDLVDLTSNKIIKSANIFLNKGVGSGDFTLNEDMPTGEYLLRGYTNWILNFADSTAFEKSIYVLPFNKEIVAKSINGVYANKSKIAPEEIKMLFYPEGGNWKKGIETRFAVKTVNKKNKGVASGATVFDSKGRKITSFSTDSLGFGDFSILSKEEGIYAVLTGDITSKKNELPKFLNTGPAFKVISYNALMQVQIQIAKQEIDLNKQYFLIGKNAEGICFKQAVKLNEINTLVNIPEFYIPTGVLLLTLNDEQHTFGERLVFIRERNEIKGYTLQTNQQNYKQEDSVTVMIKTPYPGARLSLSAFDQKTLSESPNDISSQMILGTLLKNKIENPYRYFDALNSNRFLQLDILLLTLSKSDFMMETNGFKQTDALLKAENPITISGKVVNEISNKALNKANISLSLKALNKSILIATQTDSLGRFKFENLFFTGTSALRLTSMNSLGEKTGSIELDTLNEVLKLPIHPTPSINQKTIKDTITSLLHSNLPKMPPRVKSVVLKEVKVQAKKNATLSNGMFMRYGKDQEFNLTKIDLQFKTLSWWLLNNVKGALSSTEGDESGIVFYGTDTMQYTVPRPTGGEITMFRGTNRRLNPQFVINGRDFFYEDETTAKAYRNIFFETPLVKIKSVRVQHLVGSLIGENDNSQITNIMVDRYVIYLTIDDLKGEKGILTEEVPGFYQPRPYYQTETTNQSEVYWQPNIITDNNGEAKVKFLNLGGNGKIQIQVQGLSLNGIPINITNYYQSEK